MQVRAVPLWIGSHGETMVATTKAKIKAIVVVILNFRPGKGWKTSHYKPRKKRNPRLRI